MKFREENIVSKNRRSNIELLRIIAILIIIVGYFTVHGLSNTDRVEAYKLLAKLPLVNKRF